MTTLVYLLVFCQALGASIGAFTMVAAEIEYIRAKRDGKIDDAETRHLHVIAWSLRIGMTILLIASFGLVVVAYVRRDLLQPALSASYWILIALALVVITVSWALSRQRISFSLGSAFLFTAWWFLAYLSFGWLSLSFGAAAMSFIVATAIFYAILHYARLLTSNDS